MGSTNNNAGITITITGGNPDDVCGALQRMALLLGNAATTACPPETPGDGSGAAATLDVKPETKKRTRRKKAEATPEPDAEPEAKPEAETDHAQNVVVDMTPAEARQAGIAEVQAHFAENPSSIQQITKLQEKYGVKMFADIPDDKAQAFLADVRLLVSGAGETD